VTLEVPGFTRITRPARRGQPSSVRLRERAPACGIRSVEPTRATAWDPANY